MGKEGRRTPMADPLGMLCRPTVFFAAVLFRVQALRNVFCSFLSARFSIYRRSWRFAFDSRELESLPVLAVRRRPSRVSLVCRDKSRFWIPFKVILNLM